MKRSRFTQEQIIGVLKEHQAGATAADLCRKHGISDATFYTWRSKYGGMCQRRSDFRPAWRRKSRPVTSGTGAMQRAPIGALCIAPASVGVRRE